MRHRAFRRSVSPLLPCLLFLALIPLAGAPLAAAPLFTDPLYPEEQTPIAVVAADFNGDHALDLAVLNDLSQDIAIFLADEHGDFHPLSQRIVFTEYLSAMAAADFNLDGKADLVVTEFPGNAIIYLGSGDGTFVEGASYPSGIRLRAVAVADLNGDSLEDLAIASDNDSVWILLKKADGTFQAAVASPAPGGASALTVTDFNKDGHPDIAVALEGGDDKAAMLFGHGDGAFDPPILLGGTQGGISIASGDFNQDGNPDLAIGGFNDYTVTEVLGDGSGGILARATVASQQGTHWMSAADFTGDGLLDIATASAVLPGNGDGTFGTILPFRGLPGAFAVADINGDGFPDLAGVMARGLEITPPGLFVLVNDGHGILGPRIYRSVEDAWPLVSIDFNADGFVDLAAGSSSHSGVVSVLLARGDGTFEPENRISTGPKSVDLAAGDFDGDGKPDLARYGATPSPFVSMLRGTGDGHFLDPIHTSIGITPTSLAVAELNGDGRADLVVLGNRNNFIQVLLGQADGTFQVIDQVGPPLAALTALAGDFDGDGKQDLAVGYVNATVSILLGNGDGTFNPGVTYPAASLPYSLATADLNGDGILDLAVGYASNGPAIGFFPPGCCVDGRQVSVRLGQGGGTFGEAALYDSGLSFFIGIADFDQDGKLDLMVSGAFLLRGVGDGTFLPGEYHMHAGIAGVVGDFNLDGWPDTAVAYGEVTVALNQGSGPNHPPVAEAGSEARLVCGSSAGGEALLDASASSDPDSTALQDDIASFEWFEDYGRPRQRLLGSGETLSIVLSVGMHRITLQVTDRAGAIATDEVSIRVVASPRCASRLTIRKR